MIPRGVLVLSALLASGSPETPNPQYPLPSKPSWTLKAADEFDWWKQTPPGWLLVGSGDRLDAIEPDSGRVAWTRTDLKGMNRFSLRFFPPTDLALVNLKGNDDDPRKRTLMFRVTTGENVWESDSLGLSRVDDARLIPGRSALMLIGRDAEDEKVAAAVGLANGTLLWRTRSLFRKWKDGDKVGEDPDRVRATWGFHFDTDSTLIAHMGTRTVRKVNVLRDRLVWESSQKLEHVQYGGPVSVARPGPNAESLPEYRYPEFQVSGDGATLFVSHNNTVSAINAADGTPVWKRRPDLEGAAIDWVETADRLVVLVYRTFPDPRKHVAAIDLESGGIQWFAPHTKFLGQTVLNTWSECTNLMPADNAVIVAADGELNHVNLRNAHVKKLSKLDFETSEEALFIEGRPDGYLVAGLNNVNWYDRDWRKIDSVYFNEPDNISLGIGLFALELTAGIIGDFQPSESAKRGRPAFSDAWREMNTEFHSTQDTHRFLFILADPNEGSDGIPEELSGQFIMVVDKESRATLASLPAEKEPDYKVDPSGRRVWFKRSSKRIDCYRF